MPLPFTPQEMLAIVVGASFAAGLNVYATVAVLGLLARADLFTLPPSLHLLQAWPTIAAAVALFIIEFVADKIPAFGPPARFEPPTAAAWPQRAIDQCRRPTHPRTPGNSFISFSVPISHSF